MPSVIRGGDGFDGAVASRTWIDYSSGGRLIGTTYINDKPYDKEISVSVLCAQGNTYLVASINGVSLNGNMTTNLAGMRASISFTVPSGASYAVTTHNASAASSLQWGELQ